MNGLAIDTLSRFAAGATRHRARDRERGTMRPGRKEPSVTAEVSNSGCRKRARRRCKKQVAECITALTPGCNGEPDCLADVQQCCPLLGSCNTTEFLACFVL